MKLIKQYSVGIIAFISLLFLIIDANTVHKAMQEGIELVLKIVVPALFPFLLTTTVLNRIMIGKPIPMLRIICVRCKIPQGAESIFLLGLTAGYPIGAKMINDVYTAGQISHKAAKRLLGFCNNAGPAFIFGILGPMFTQKSTGFCIWIIHIMSAIITGILLPGDTADVCHILREPKQSFSQVISQCIKTMAVISTWVIMWKVILAICAQYFLFKIPVLLRVIITGLCELTNGSLDLQSINNEVIRFVIASSLLSCGGFCIALQTSSVTKNLGMGMYLPGKLLQTAISAILSTVLSYALYPTAVPHSVLIVIPISVLAICVTLFLLKRKEKIMVAFRSNMIYNQ